VAQKNDYTEVSPAAMQETFFSILLKNGLSPTAATECATVFTQSSVDGVYTHGVNRFPRFVDYLQKGYVNKTAVPSLSNKFNGIEQWDGHLGAGITNANFATEQSMRLAAEFGMGCVALANTHHWMRGGTYAWKAAKAGFIFIGWTNTIANMPAWNATDAKLGNNPLVIAMPYQNEAIVLDMAMSQYSFGALELAAMKNETLPVAGGFDVNSVITNNPADIIASNRVMPTGYWKGAGLSLLLDILATVLSGGFAVHEITKKEAEFGLSQVFISIDISKLGSSAAIVKAVENIIADYKNSIPANEKDAILYPGERVLATRKRNNENGIPVLQKIWNAVLQLK
jgi:3-dehydro-L-gulonate 2-dehydrogenase